MTIDLSMRWQVVEGDCLAVMPTLPEACVDAVVTDPPYGLAFMGKEWDHGVPGEVFWTEALRVARPGAHLLAFGGTRTFHRLACAIEDAGWEIRDCLSWLYGSGFPKSHNGAWGGTALKPAWEPVIVARKPLVGTVAANHAAHGTGALNIDGCRIEGAKASGSGGPPLRFGGQNARPFHEREDYQPRDFDTSKGRWPANVVLDEEAARRLDEQSGYSEDGTAGTRTGACAGEFLSTLPPRDTQWGSYGGAGGASRFFYTAKASRSEREAGLRGERRPKNTHYGDGFNSATKLATAAQQEAGAVDRGGIRNTHPTVKPVDLMRWLVRLVTPVGGLVLDPFTGSGTTGVACHDEGLRFLGIEREAEYVAIARARIEAAARQAVLPLAGGA